LFEDKKGKDMNNKIWLSLIFSVSFLFSKNQFMGIVEDGSVNKNKFLCPLSLNASGNIVCNNMDTEMIGFDFSEGSTIQIFNNQQYWLQQKFEREHLLMVQGYKRDRLSSTMTSEGWDQMGAFSIIISTDPILAQAIEPDKVAATGEIKLIVQLWYSAPKTFQLWAQDVQLLKSGQNFKILVSNGSSAAFKNSLSVNPYHLLSFKKTVSTGTALPGLTDTQKVKVGVDKSQNPLPSLKKTVSTATALPSLTDTPKVTVGVDKSQKSIPTTLQNFKQQFLEKVGFAPDYINKDDYNVAFGSPRNIEIQVQ